MALSHLIDTSVLTKLGDARVRTMVDLLASGGRIGRAGISDLEIGFSVRNAGDWDRLQKALQVFVLIETKDDVRRARQVQRLLARRSQRGRKVPDLLVAAAAEAESLIVLHYGADFDQISKVTGQPCEWVAPAGSVD